jgi:hypothetical protein
MKCFYVLCVALFAALPTTSVAVNSVTVRVEAMETSSIPRGAMRVPVFSMTLDVPCNTNVTLESIRLQHRGMGRIQDITAVYAMVDGVRVSRAVTPESSNGQVEVRFESHKLEPCATEEMMFVMDIASDADVGGSHAFIVTDSQNIHFTGAAVIFNNATISPRSIASQNQGSVTFTSLPLLLQPRYGDDRTVARFRIEASGLHQVMTEITLINSGSANADDLQNLVLVDSRGQKISDIVSQLAGRSARFILKKPLYLEQGKQQILMVKANIRASRRRTIALGLHEQSDLHVQPARSRR